MCYRQATRSLTLKPRCWNECNRLSSSSLKE
nr:MAG TPA: hypothetical protein [Caudoviricetes sp.]